MMPRRRSLRTTAALLALSLTCLAGCDGLTYVLHVAEGELSIQGETEPIGDVLASGGSGKGAG